MDITPNTTSGLGLCIWDFDPATATTSDIDVIRKYVYDERVVVLKNQDLGPAAFADFGRKLGDVVRYYEPMYAHPDEPDVFVSSNVKENGQQIGVPKTGKFWHADYMFMPEPFAFTVFYPQQLPAGNRGTFFVDLAEAYDALSEDLRSQVHGRTATHSVRKFFKIRPDDVYRPLSELIDEIETKTPPATFPLAFEHPVTGRPQLFCSQGFTVSLDDGAPKGLLNDVLTASGQLDPEFTHPLIHQHGYELGDIVIWDNRRLIHRALHTTTNDPAVSYRVTVADGNPLYRTAL